MKFLYFFCIDSIFLVFTFNGHNRDYRQDHIALLKQIPSIRKLFSLFHRQSIAMQFLIVLFYGRNALCTSN